MSLNEQFSFGDVRWSNEWRSERHVGTAKKEVQKTVCQFQTSEEASGVVSKEAEESKHDMEVQMDKAV